MNSIQTIRTFFKVSIIFSVASCSTEYFSLLAMAPFLVENLEKKN